VALIDAREDAPKWTRKDGRKARLNFMAQQVRRRALFGYSLVYFWSTARSHFRYSGRLETVPVMFKATRKGLGG
jgi:hypothetical protein